MEINKLENNKNLEISNNIEIGEKQKSLTAKILPENVNADSNITWSSSNNNVANVDSKGNITANKKGTSIITVKTGNGKTAWAGKCSNLKGFI